MFFYKLQETHAMKIAKKKPDGQPIRLSETALLFIHSPFIFHVLFSESRTDIFIDSTSEAGIKSNHCGEYQNSNKYNHSKHPPCVTLFFQV